MITVNAESASTMLKHAREAYPKECCGILLGRETNGERTVAEAFACRNAYEGGRPDRFSIDPADQLAADRRARSLGLDVLGFFHSHPDEAAYFSSTDLQNSWPWYSNIVLSIRKGEFAGAACFRANDDRTESTSEELVWPKS